MEIKNIKELQQVIKACRKLGVNSIAIGNISFQLSNIEQSKMKPWRSIETFPEENVKIPPYNGDHNNNKATTEVPPPEQITTDELTEEQLLMWSAGSSVP